MAVSEELSHKMSGFGFFCAILIVFIHVYYNIKPEDGVLWWTWICVAQGVSRIAVPFFFVASGFWLAGHVGEQGWWRREIVKRLSSLVLPFVAWNLLWYGYNLAICAIANIYAGRDVAANFSNLPTFASIVGFDVFHQPSLGVLWYVRALMLLVAISPLFVFLVRKFGMAVVALMYMLMLLVAIFPLPCPFSLLNVSSAFLPISAIFFFVAGLYFRCCQSCFRIRFANKMFLAVLCGVGIILYAFSIRVGFKYAEVLRCSMLPLWLAIIWWLFPTNSKLTHFAKYSFPIYLLHQFSILTISLLKLPVSLVNYFFIGLIAIVVSILLTFLVRRTTPRLAQILFGGR